MAFCPACGTKNVDGAQYCVKCGRQLEDVAEVRADMAPPAAADRHDAKGRILAADGRPVGEDLDGEPGGERSLWRGRPSWIFSPIAALMTRYHLTSERLIVEYGFIGRRTEEIELYRVEDVAVKQNPFERIFRFGDVRLISGDRTTPTRVLHNVTDPLHVKDVAREASRAERQRRRVLVREEF